ncbi:deoxynucleoside kinase [Myxococcota bacterium]|nr:deoxynucleoside kinase [Myxococcota bacterium]MBU1898037.1 deoxynucleoside kinase [Myxococcota bacterium]
MSRPLYIAVEGPIGVGKTTLVHRLAERLDARLVLESFEDNPFLPKFYADKARYAFQTQLFFLMSRFQQQKELFQADIFAPNTLADYHILKDRIFAQLTLKEDELALYEKVYFSLEGTTLEPDVVVYLHASTSVLLERISCRGRAFEEDFDAAYLDQLSEMYHHHFSHYDRTPMISLDTSEIDYVRDEGALDEIEALICASINRDPCYALNTPRR